MEGGDAPWQLTFHVLSSARFSLRSVRRLIFAERITPSCSTSRPLAASAWSRTVSLKQQGGKDEDRRCNGFDNEAKPGLQHDDLKPPTDASVDLTDAQGGHAIRNRDPADTCAELGVGDMMGAEREPFGVKQRLMLEVCRELDPTQKSGHTVDEGPL